MQSGNHRVEVVERAEPWIDVPVVINVVAAVGERGWIKGAQPYRVDAERPR